MTYEHDRMSTACFSGHRPGRFEWGYDESDIRCVSLRENIKKHILQAIERGYRHFICGGAMGVDMWCGEAALDIRDSMGGVTLEVAVPCEGQERRWPQELRERYAALLERADRKLILSRSYTPSCMMERNRYMVSNSGLLIAVFDGVYKGGTWQTIKLAMLDRLEVDILPVK